MREWGICGKRIKGRSLEGKEWMEVEETFNDSEM
jgi:hypothetical protein